MKTLEKYENEKIPEWALCYLVNGDSSGLKDNEIKDCDNYVSGCMGDTEGHFIISVESEEGYFSSSPEFGLPCNVYDCTVLIGG